jgi:hypothetical protein
MENQKRPDMVIYIDKQFNDLQKKTTQNTQRSSIMNLTKNGVNSGAQEG